MNIYKSLVLISFALFVSAELFSQERVTTVGFQVKPIFSSRFFGTGPQTLRDSGYSYEVDPSFGYAVGMVIRRGFTPTLSLEFGLNYTRRDYNISATNGIVSDTERMKVVGYEIPISQLIFIRLSEKIYMNASAGACVNMFPSDVFQEADNFLAYAGRKNIFIPSLLANLGFEYRTEDSGYFYIGASLNRPFQPIFGFSIDYLQDDVVLNSAISDLNGTYLSVDFKYFFKEDPEKKGNRRK